MKKSEKIELIDKVLKQYYVNDKFAEDNTFLNFRHQIIEAMEGRYDQFAPHIKFTEPEKRKIVFKNVN